MRKTILYIAMSLDGYIADPSGGVNWLGGDGSHPEDEGSYPAFYETVDTILLGYNTYHQIQTELFPDHWIYSGKTSYVFTHRQERSTGEIIFTEERPETLIARLKSQEGRNLWICGGADLLNQFVSLDLIDRYHITVIPTILGDGIRLFRRHSTERKLRLLSTQESNGMVDLVYEPRS